jgi:hypothetical protein
MTCRLHGVTQSCVSHLDILRNPTNSTEWYFTKDQGHWNRSTMILDAWGSGLVDITGTDTSLLIGLEGDMLQMWQKSCAGKVDG